ncbi:unnamed protein product [Closterium sp. NIES-54]
MRTALRALRYLVDTADRVIRYERQGGEQVVGYTDSDWGGETDGKSRSAYIFKLGGGAISWYSKRQDSVAASVSEAEYKALSEGAKETIWLRSLLAEMHVGDGGAIPLLCDNEAAVSLAHNPVLHQRTKHIKDADMLTKALPSLQLHENLERIGMRVMAAKARASDADGWYSRIPPEPPEPRWPPVPPAPPTPPSPPAPPAPPVPPAPLPLGPVSPQITGNQPVLTLLLPSAFDEYLSEPESNKAQDEYVEVEHFPGGRWGQPDDCPWDESAVGVDDDVADAEEASGADGAEGGTETSARGGAQGGTADDVFPEGVTGDADDDGVEHKLTDHKRQGYTAAEKLKWVALMDLAVSVRALARESGIHRKCLTKWKRTTEFLKDVHSARKRMHGRGQASWYRPMELKVYEKLLEWRRKGTAVSVGRLQEWSREFMKLLYPDKKWKGSQRWSERFRRRWNLSVRMKTRAAQKTAAHVAEQCKSFWQFVRAKRRERGIDNAWIINADQTPLWLEMPATTTVEETGVCSVPIRSAGYQKQRVTVMLECTADGRKLKPWVFFKRKTLPKGDFPAGK